MRKFILDLAAFASRVFPVSIQQAIYKVKPLAGLIRRELNRAAPSGLTEVSIAGGDLAGCSMLLDMQVDKDYWLGTYEPELQAALKKIVPTGSTVYDIGANIGYVSLLMAKTVGEGGRVFAFEALPANVKILQRNIELNAMGSRVTIIPKAIVDKAGAVHFLVHASGGMGKVAGSAGREADYEDDILVDGISLDEFVFEQGNPPPQVVKVDIEGGEVLAFPGMIRVFSEVRPVFLMELHGTESCHSAWATLKTARYEIHWMKKGFPLVSSREAMDWKAYVMARPI